jgi:hypothetical protein
MTRSRPISVISVNQWSDFSPRCSPCLCASVVGFLITRSRAITGSPDLPPLFPHGCPTTTIDSGPPPVAEVEIKAVVVLAAVMFAFNTDTVFDPLFAT